MKKSAHILLTLVTSLVISSCAVNNSLPQNNYLPDSLAMVDESDTTRYHEPRYDYVYGWRWYDNFYRLCFPRRYYTILQQPGFIPRHVRQNQGIAQGKHASRSRLSHGIAEGKHPSRSSGRNSTGHSRSSKSSPARGGFGHTGGHHSSVG